MKAVLVTYLEDLDVALPDKILIYYLRAHCSLRVESIWL